MVFGKRLRFDIIGLLNIYHHDPWDLPGLAKIGEREWYFFVPRDRKHGSGGRPNRTTENGYWKATGSDRKIFSLSDPKRSIGLRKTLVFYQGRAPRGGKTDWIMNEYRLPDSCSVLKDIVLCKIYRKATPVKVLEQRAAMEEEEMKAKYAATPTSPMSPIDTMSFSTVQQEQVVMAPLTSMHQMVCKKEEQEASEIGDKNDPAENNTRRISSLVKLPPGSDLLSELQVPKFSLDWTQDNFWTQLNSPWLQNLTPCANILNF